MYEKIAVLYGGLSSEREVSLSTGKAVYEALLKLGYNAILIDVDRDIAFKLRETKPDYCFIALHGRFGEDGTIQGLLEIMGIPYSGADVASSAVAYDKVLSKMLVEKMGFKTPDYYLAKDYKDIRLLPCVVKPAREGSTIGVSIVKKESDFFDAYTTASKYDDKVLVEKFIYGKEITVGIVNSKIFPPIWIKPKKGFYDYESKYTKGMTEYIFETELDEKELKILADTTLKIAKGFGCTKLCRIDFIYDNGHFYFLEINSIPGMTETSLLPKAAAKMGISFEQLVEMIIKGE